YFNLESVNLLALPLASSQRKQADADARPLVLIYGAGAAGNQLLSALRLGREMRPVGFIDDSPGLAGRVMAGLTIYSPDKIEYALKDTGAQEVLLAIPSSSRARRNEIIEMLAEYSVQVRTVPGFMDLASGRVQVEDLRHVDIDDLLGRDSVKPNMDLFERCIR